MTLKIYINEFSGIRTSNDIEHVEFKSSSKY